MSEGGPKFMSGFVVGLILGVLVFACAGGVVLLSWSAQRPAPVVK